MTFLPPVPRRAGRPAPRPPHRRPRRRRGLVDVVTGFGHSAIAWTVVAVTGLLAGAPGLYVVAGTAAIGSLVFALFELHEEVQG